MKTSASLDIHPQSRCWFTSRFLDIRACYYELFVDIPILWLSVEVPHLLDWQGLHQNRLEVQKELTLFGYVLLISTNNYLLINGTIYEFSLVKFSLCKLFNADYIKLTFTTWIKYNYKSQSLSKDKCHWKIFFRFVEYVEIAQIPIKRKVLLTLLYALARNAN